ncbi:MAG: mechanosensitive ion channel [Burkholderiales bacterium]|nr:mechanosensitive ion channel [Burkholderiales bacterium]
MEGTNVMHESMRRGAARALRRTRCRLIAAWAAALFLGAAATAYAQAGPAATSPTGNATDSLRAAPVTVDGRDLFRVAGLTLYPAEKRAREISERIGKLAEDPGFSVEQLRLREVEDATEFVVGENRVLALVDADAQLEGLPRKVLAVAYAKQIGDAVRAHREERTAAYLTRSGLYTAAMTAILVLALWALRWSLAYTTNTLRARFQPRLADIQSKSFGMLGADQFWRVVERGIRGLWWLALVIAAYAYVDFALSRFPWTRHASRWLLNLVLDPLRIMGQAVAESIPGLAFIAILFIIVRYLLLWLHLVLVGIGSGTIRVAGFEREWAVPTYQLLRFGLIAFAVVMAYPYIPGSGSDAFKGISVFVGVLFSIGSSTMLGNVLAGYTLVYQKAFRVGDRVMIGEYVGDITLVKQQVTLLRTVHSEEVVIPNATVLGSKIVNYSAMARADGVILYTSVTIGYDTPWRQVDAMLLAAAERTPGLLTDPKPFVLKRGLEDFYVKYELNAYSRDASTMLQQYSMLHQNIIDEFNEHGVQIMSPHFMAQPDQAVLVPKESWFVAPARGATDGAPPRETGGGKP